MFRSKPRIPTLLAICSACRKAVSPRTAEALPGIASLVSTGWLSWHFVERPALSLKRRATAPLLVAWRMIPHDRGERRYDSVWAR